MLAKYLIIRPKLCFALGESWKYSTGQKPVLTCSAITPPKVNRFFGWNLEHCEGIVGGWSWQILGTIRGFCAVATVSEASEILYCFGQVNNARFHRLPIGQNLWHLNITTSISKAVKTFRTEFRKLYRKESCSKKGKIAHKISRSCDFWPP